MANESLLKYGVKESIGQVNAVDTGTATVVVTDDSVLSQLQINQLLAIISYKKSSSRATYYSNDYEDIS